MPNRELLKQLEIEKQRRGISRVNAGAASEPEVLGLQGSEHRYAWEYELESYRAQKKKIKWLVMGSFCGVLSLILEAAFHWGSILELAKLWPLK